MARQLFKKLLKLTSTRNISALYLTRDKAKENYVALQPYMNFDEILHHTEDIRKNLHYRNVDIDVDNLKNKYINLKKFIKQKHYLEKCRENVVEQLRLENQNAEDQCKITAIKNEGRNIRNELKVLKENLHIAEEDLIVNFLKLPNKLHRDCPLESEKILYTKGKRFKTNSNNGKVFHLNKKNLISFENSSCYYLMNEAALFDLEFSMECTNYFVQNGFCQFVNPDFSRKILLEAIYCENIQEYDEIKEHENLISKINTLHLNGGGSFSSFLGFFSKLSIYPSLLPLKLVSLGRHYYNTTKTLDFNQEKGLFTAIQSNTIQIFVATLNESSADKEMEAILNLVVHIYDNLGIHFRIIYDTARNILPSESLKISIQMWSSYFQEYIEVGHISNYENFISKRILFNVKDGRSINFPYIIGGPIADISKILGCLIENNTQLETHILNT